MVEHRLVTYSTSRQPPMFGKRRRNKTHGRVTEAGKQAGGFRGTGFGCSCGGFLIGGTLANAIQAHARHVKEVAERAVLDEQVDAELADLGLL